MPTSPRPILPSLFSNPQNRIRCLHIPAATSPPAPHSRSTPIRVPRPHHRSITAMSTTSPPLHLSIPAKEDSEIITDAVRKLTEQTHDGIPSWEVVLEGKGLRRRFRFKGFNKCWAFMNAVAEQCKAAKHHPEWTNAYNTTTIIWTTHSPQGLTSKDVEMAEYCDQKAKEFGEVGDDVAVRGCGGEKEDGKG